MVRWTRFKVEKLFILYTMISYLHSFVLINIETFVYILNKYKRIGNLIILLLFILYIAGFTGLFVNFRYSKEVFISCNMLNTILTKFFTNQMEKNKEKTTHNNDDVYYNVEDVKNIFQNDMKQMKSVNEELQKENYELQINYNNVCNSNETIKNEYDSLLSAHELLRNEYETIKNEYDSLLSAHELLQNKYDSLDDNYKHLQTKYRSISNKYKKYEVIDNLDYTSIGRSAKEDKKSR